MRPTAHSVSYVKVSMVLDNKLTLENLEEFCKLLRSYDVHDTQRISLDESENSTLWHTFSVEVNR